jgi:hypothetical protein
METIQTVTPTNPISLNILNNTLPLPEGSVIAPYITTHKKKQSKDSAKRKKYNSFSYYKLKDDTIVKVLFLDAERYL